jgi:uncharacterized membrane protein
MSLWLVLVVVGQFLNALVALVDKYIVTSETVVVRPFTYAFWVSVMSAFSVFIFFFSWIPIPIADLSIPSFGNIERPSLLVAALAITAGYSFFTALLSLFTALKQADASDAIPVIGGLNAVFTLLLSFAFLEGTGLSPTFFMGFVLLVLGTVVVSRFRFTWQTMLATAHAGLMYGIHYIAIKALFNETNFDTAFFWSRLAIAAIALSMLLIPEYYEKIMSKTRAAKKRDIGLVVGNKLLAGLASIILLKAIEIGDVSIVQALGGLQYLFLLGISVIFGPLLARDFGENVTRRDVIHKVISIPLSAAGFFLLFV